LLWCFCVLVLWFFFGLGGGFFVYVGSMICVYIV
jgi:hypothetical protein